MNRVRIFTIAALISPIALAQELQETDRSSLRSAITELSETRFTVADRFQRVPKPSSPSSQKDPFRILDGKIDQLYKQSLKQESLRQKIFQMLPRLFPREDQTADPKPLEETSDTEMTTPIEAATTPEAGPKNPDPEEAEDVPPDKDPTSPRIQIESITSPVDLLGAGNNFYEFGNYSLALAAYQRILKTDVTNDQMLWVDFQKANCYRYLGNHGKAVDLYREISLSKDGPQHITRAAKWWLKYVEDFAELQKNLESLEKGTETLRKQINDAS